MAKVLGINWRWSLIKSGLAALLVAILGLSLGSCSSTQSSPGFPGLPKPSAGNLSEVAPPMAIRELRQELEIYQPQVKILSPRADEVLKDTQASVRLQVQDLPIFQDEELELGPHLHLILDNRPYQAVYDASKPVVLKDLEPGTHTLRVFASRPWHESFKNEGAYAQITFHIFTKTPEHHPDPAKPLLTYSRPKGDYGAEPVMLDFYLSNAPLHLVAKENAEDDILDWKVRCTINGESFTFDRWEPIYLKGFKPGKNWVQLELLDENGNAISNTFNNTVRVINYEPGGTDSLSKLVRGEIAIAEARAIVDPNYTPPVAPEPAPESAPPEPGQLPTPDLTAEPTPEPLPELIPPSASELEAPTPNSSPAASEEPIEPQKETEKKVTESDPLTAPALIQPDASVSPLPTPALPKGNVSPIAAPDSGKVKEELPEEVKELLNQAEKTPQPKAEQPAAKSSISPLKPEPTKQTKSSPLPAPEAKVEASPAIAPSPISPSEFSTPSPLPSPTLVPAPSPQPETSTLRELFNRSKGFFDQLLHAPAEPTKASSPVSLPEALKTPIGETSASEEPIQSEVSGTGEGAAKEFLPQAIPETLKAPASSTEVSSP